MILRTAINSAIDEWGGDRFCMTSYKKCTFECYIENWKLSLLLDAVLLVFLQPFCMYCVKICELLTLSKKIITALNCLHFPPSGTRGHCAISRLTCCCNSPHYWEKKMWAGDHTHLKIEISSQWLWDAIHWWEKLLEKPVLSVCPDVVIATLNTKHNCVLATLNTTVLTPKCTKTILANLGHRQRAQHCRGSAHHRSGW